MDVAFFITFERSSSSSTILSSLVAVDEVIILPFSPKTEVLDPRPTPGADKDVLSDTRLPDSLAQGNALNEQKQTKRLAKMRMQLPNRLKQNGPDG